MSIKHEHLPVLGNTRHYFWMSLLVCLAPFVGHAQEPLPVHNWTLRISGRTYGLVQWRPYVGNHEDITTIYLGAHTNIVHTSLPAPCLAILVLLPVAALGFFVTMGLTRHKKSS
jgi:hypothetical protein